MRNKLSSLTLVGENLKKRIEQLQLNYVNISKEVNDNFALLKAIKTNRLTRSLAMYMQESKKESISNKDEFPAVENLPLIVASYSPEYMNVMDSIGSNLENIRTWIGNWVLESKDEFCEFLKFTGTQIAELRKTLEDQKAKIERRGDDVYTAYLLKECPTMIDIPAPARINLITVSHDVLKQIAPIDISRYTTDSEYKTTVIANLKVVLSGLKATNGLTIDDQGLVSIDTGMIDPMYVLPTSPVDTKQLGYDGKTCTTIVDKLLDSFSVIETCINNPKYVDSISTPATNPVSTTISSETKIVFKFTAPAPIVDGEQPTPVPSPADAPQIVDNINTKPIITLTDTANHVSSYVVIIKTCITNIVNSALMWT